MKLHDTGAVVEALNDLDFPADKQSIVEHARARGAAEEAERALRALPLGEYANMAEILRSVPVDPDPDRTASERVQQHRAPGRKTGMSESTKPFQKNPLEDT
jgi:hypothetical protein